MASVRIQEPGEAAVFPGRDADVGLLGLRKIQDDRVVDALVPAFEEKFNVGLEIRDDVQFGPLEAGLLLRFPERRVQGILARLKMPLVEIPVSSPPVEQQEFYAVLGPPEDY